MTVNSILEPTQPVSGSVNRITGFLTNLVDKGIEYKVLREENKLALSQINTKNDNTSGQELATKPDLGNGAREAAQVTNPIVNREDNLFKTYGIPAIAVISGGLALYAIFRKKGKN